LTFITDIYHQNAHAAVEYLEREMPEFILPLMWPPNLPYLNLVDYSVWSILQEVYETGITGLDDLKHLFVLWNTKFTFLLIWQW